MEAISRLAWAVALLHSLKQRSVVVVRENREKPAVPFPRFSTTATLLCGIHSEVLLFCAQAE